MQNVTAPVLPFTHVVDLNVTQEFSIKTGKTRHTLSVRFDMFNFTNFIDKMRAASTFSFDQAQVLSFEGFTGTTPRYKFNQPANGKSRTDQ